MRQAIEVTGLYKSYGKNDVLKGVEFAVAPGSIFALLGSNGAGKTTIINILTTLIDADAGSAIVNGFDVLNEPRHVRQSISMTGQFAAVDEILTARENLELIGDLRHVANAKETATQLITKFDLVDAADRPVATYSGGMRRRLDIAMSLIGEPPIIFLDEPTTGLDPQARNEMWETIRTMASRGTTIFLTTQYLEEADVLADSIAVLHDGKIIAHGSSAELKKLVPVGFVKFTFADADLLSRAVSVLGDDFEIAESSELCMTVTDNGISQIAQIFTKLSNAYLEPVDFSQQTPTLDDVYFKLTSNREGVK